MRRPASKCLASASANTSTSSTHQFFLLGLIVFVCICCLIDTCNSQELEPEELSRKSPNRRKGSPLKGSKPGDKNQNSTNHDDTDDAPTMVLPTKIKSKPTKHPSQPSKKINKRHQVKPLTINDANRFLNNALPKKRVDRCPLCDSSVYSYCSDKLLHDACCCLSPYETALPYQCQYADCSFLHANSCREHHLITACCCDKVVYL